jgi:hypothetical protein
LPSLPFGVTDIDSEANVPVTSDSIISVPVTVPVSDFK